MPIDLAADALTVSSTMPEGVPVATGVTTGQLGELVEDAGALAVSGFEAKPGQVAAVGVPMRLLVGLGDGASCPADVRSAVASVVRRSAKLAAVAVELATMAGDLPAGDVARAAAEGALLGTYRFDELKGRPGDERPLARVHLVHPDAAGLTDEVRRGAVVAAGVALTRDLVNRPGGTLNARDLAAVAEDVGRRDGLDVQVWDLDRCRAERLGGLLGVNAGSVEEPRLIRLEYVPAGGETGSVALVGKGITFDSGGLSLKPADGMHTMKSDMGGAAAIIGAMSALAAVEPSVRVTGFIASTDNMPSGSAMKVGDVITIRDGTTVEVLNTDAEGRLVLADALALAVEERPDVIVDLATLTGAAVVALGQRYAGLMGNDDALRDELLEAADGAGERFWPLPLPEEYRKDIDSKVADLRNVGTDRFAGALRAGLFLQEFVDGVPWAHLDIAGPVFSDDTDGDLTGGATGFGVRTLLGLLAARSS